jgi:UrcA family protein
MINTTNGYRRNITRATWAATLTAVSAILVLNTAQAEDQAGVLRQQVVRLADLDLNKNDDVATLYKRIQIAANKVCGWMGPVAPDWWRISKSCTDHAIAEGIASIGNPALTSRYLAERGGSKQPTIIAQAH